jgi:hypothetical protein
MMVLMYIYTSFDGSEKKDGRISKRFIGFFLWKLVFAWFPCRLVRARSAADDSLDPSRRYIFAMHPHGVLAFGRITLSMLTRTWDKLFPGIQKRVLSASAAFCIPFIREAWLSTECVSADKKTAEYCLHNEDNPCSLCVYPGGHEEQLLTKTHKYRFYLKNRKGFVKLALEHGAPLVPVIIFGETSLYTTHETFLPNVRHWLAKKMRLSIPVFSGWLFVLPYRVPLTGVVGRSILVPHIPHPSDDEIKHWHARYIHEIKTLFEEEKGFHGYADAELEIH